MKPFRIVLALAVAIGVGLLGFAAAVLPLPPSSPFAAR